MTTRGRRLPFGFLVAALIVGVPALAHAAAADFMFGTLSWQRDTSFTQASQARFLVHVEAGFRTSAITPTPVQGSVVAGAVSLTHTASGPQVVDVPLTVESVNTSEDWFVGQGTATITVQLSDLPMTVVVDACCRTASLTDGNQGRAYRLTTTIPAASGVLVSPRTTALPRIYLTQGVPATMVIPHTSGSLRLATTTESRLAVAAPPGLALAADGTLTWTPANTGLYAIQVVMDDGAGTVAPADFTIRVEPPDPTQITFAPGSCSQQIPLTVGREATFSVTANSSTPGDVVAIANTPLPEGAELIQQASGSTTTKVFRWTPPHQVSNGLASGGQLQNTVSICFLAQGAATSSLGQCCVTLQFTPTELLPLSGTLRSFQGLASAGFNVADGDDTVRIVGDTLDANGRPVFAPAGPLTTIPTAAAFTSWWTDGPSSVTSYGTVYLSNGAGGSLFRFEDSSFNPLEGLAGANYFTYEAHTTISYEPGATLSFASADDLWVFVNGKLVVDLGGVHQRKQVDVSLDALAPSLGLLAAGDYPVDIFYAHRGQHQPLLELDLLRGRQCTLPPAADVDPATLTMMNSAHLLADGTLQLSRQGQQPPPGDPVPALPAPAPDAAWTPAVAVTHGIDVQFQYETVGGEGVEGLALVLAAQPGLGGDQGSLGYAGIDHSVAVEFDSIQDIANSDPPDPHIAVQTRGVAANSAVHSQPAWLTTNLYGTCYFHAGACAPVGVIGTHQAHVRYDVVAGSPTGWLRVWQDELSPDAVPSLEVPIALSDWNATFPSGVAFVGLTTSAIESLDFPPVITYFPSDVLIRNWKVAAMPSGSGDTCGTACADDGSVCTEDVLVGGTCVHPPGARVGVQCRNAGCTTGGLLVEAAVCGTGPDCPASQTTSCGQYSCGGHACLTGCNQIDQCALSALCTANQCLADLSPPDVVLDSLPTATNQAALQPSGSVSDNGKITSVTFSFNGAQLGPFQPNAQGKVSSSPVTLLEGDNTVALTATDRAGNVGATPVVHVQLDTVPPVPTLMTPGAIVHGTISLTASASDGGSGVASLALAVNGTAIGQCASATTCTKTFDTSTLPDGGFVVTVGAVDVAGNTAASAGVSFEAINAVPFVESPVSACIAPACFQETVDLGGGLGTVGGAEFRFGTVSVPGQIAVAKSGTGCPPPTGFEIVKDSATTGGTGLYWNIDTNALFSGTVGLCLAYDPTSITSQGLSEDHLKLVHGTSTPATGCNLVGGGWTDVTTINGVCKTNGCLAGTGGPLQPACSPCAHPATICGVTPSFSPFVILAPIDHRAPGFTGVPPSPIVAYATSAAGAAVTFTLPTATDDLDGPCAVSCDRASGSTFALGHNAVTCTAVDTSGNTATTSFDVWVQVQAPTNGSFFLQPINPDGSSLFKGSTIPVKFQLTGASATIGDLVAHIAVSQVATGPAGTDLEAISTAVSDTGTLFRYDAAARQYIFNLSTKSMSGTYRLLADLGDGVVHQVNVSIKPSK